MVRLTTVSNSIDATFLQHKLAEQGIESFLTNENTSTLLPHLNGILGHGIQIMVSKDDLDKATKILAIRETEQAITTCPNCGSTNVKFGMRGKKRIGEYALIFLSMIFMIPMGNIRNKYYCKDCGEDFQ